LGAPCTVWVIEGLSISRVLVLPTAVTQKTFKALPVRCSGEAPPGTRGIGKLNIEKFKFKIVGGRHIGTRRQAVARIADRTVSQPII